MLKIFDTLKALRVEKPTERDKDYSSDILTWDSHKGINDYPNQVLRAITLSPTASACMATRTSYIRGGGFNISGIEDIRVNREDSFSAFHNGLAETVNKLKGIAIHVQRNIEGKIVQLTKMPFEDFRLSIPDDFGNVNSVVYNPRWSEKDFKVAENITYDLYTPDPAKYQERVQRFKEENPDKKYKGEIYWKFIKKDGFPYYPYSFSEFDIKAFETDQAFTDFDYNNIYNNFFLGAVMNVYGNPNDPVTEPYRYKKKGEWFEDERYLGTRGELFDREMQENFGGGANAGKIMVNWMKNEAEKIDIESFPVSTNSDLFQQTQARVWNKIALITQVPNVLANIETAGKLGNSQEILNSIQLLNNSVTIQQSLLEQAYNELLPNHILFEGRINESVKIQKLNPVTFIPDKVWEVIPLSAKLDYVRENYNVDIKVEETPQINAKQVKAEKSYNDYPEAAVDNAKKVIEWKEEHPDEIQGMTQVGWIRANQLANRENLTEDTIGKMAAFERHRGNSELSEEFKGTPWKDAGYVAWLGWGGDEGIKWAQDKLDEIEDGNV